MERSRDDHDLATELARAAARRPGPSSPPSSTSAPPRASRGARASRLPLGRPRSRACGRSRRAWRSPAAPSPWPRLPSPRWSSSSDRGRRPRSPGRSPNADRHAREASPPSTGVPRSSGDSASQQVRAGPDAAGPTPPPGAASTSSVRRQLQSAPLGSHRRRPLRLATPRTPPRGRTLGRDGPRRRPAEVADDAAEVFDAVHAVDGIVLSSSVTGGAAATPAPASTC